MATQQRRYRVAFLAVIIVLVAVALRSGRVSDVPATDRALPSVVEDSDFPFGPDLLVSAEEIPYVPVLGDGTGQTTDGGSTPGQVAAGAAEENVRSLSGESPTSDNQVASASDDHSGLPFSTASGTGAPAPGAFGISGGGFINTVSSGGFGGGPTASPAAFAARGAQSPDGIGNSSATARALGIREGSLQIAETVETEVPETGSTNPTGPGESSAAPPSDPVALLVEGPPLDLKGSEPPDPAAQSPGGSGGAGWLAPGDTEVASVPPPPQIVNPEPASVLLLGTGLTLVARRLRKHRR